MAKAKEPNTEVFRFMSVRTAKQAETIAPNVSTVDYDSTYAEVGASAIGAMQAANGDLLYTTLTDTITGGGTRSDLEDDVTAFRSTDDYISDRPALFQRFAGFDSVHGWLNTNAESATIDEAKTAIEDFIGGTINDFLFDADFNENNLRLWDNLFAQIILLSNNNLRDDITKVLKMFRVLQVIDENEPSSDPLKNFVRWSIMTVVLPKAIFPLPEASAVIAPSPNMPSAPSDPDNTQFFEDIGEIEDAITDIDNITRQQFDALRREQVSQQPPIVSGASSRPPSLKKRSQVNPFDLKDEFKNKLKPETLATISANGISLSKMNAINVTDSLKSRIANLWRTSYTANLGERLVVINGTVISSKLMCLASVATGACDYYAGGTLPTRAGKVQSMQVGDLMLVKRYLLKYQAGEVAHIENILQNEFKKRTHEHLRREEERITTETERTTFEERDLQTTDRFSLEQATSEVTNQQSSLQAGTSLTASYGPISLSANANYSNTSGNSSSNSSASEFSREVTSRALKRVTERVRTERTKITIEEIKETNVHGFGSETTPATDNISGIYTWVDKLYLAKLINYGKRLMMEFTIPEPAAFYIYSKAINKFSGDLIEPKTLAENGISNFSIITAQNYGTLAQIYETADIQPPPVNITVSSITIKHNDDGGTQNYTNYFTDAKEIQIPQGYLAQSAVIRFGTSWDSLGGQGVATYVAMNIGQNNVYGSSGNIVTVTLNNERDIVPVALFSHDSVHNFITIEVTSQLSPEKLEEWQIKTYNSILASYQKKLSDFENAIAAKEIQAGVEITGNNPLINQQIVREEFKKSVIESLTGQRFEAFMAMQDGQLTEGYPEFNFDRAAAEGNYMSFFENAVEWENMTWSFYPYFWGRKSHWVDKMRYLTDQTDPEFTEFLRAGAARVMIPIRPTLSKSMLYYLQSNGDIWAGDDVALTSQYETLINDLNRPDPSDALIEYPVQIDPPWIIKMPTTLVTLPIGGPANYDHLPNYMNQTPDIFAGIDFTNVDMNG